jgi:restriction system protein
MDIETARDELQKRLLDLSSEQFEQLCKMVLERAEQTRDLELTPFRGDGGIDVHAIIDRELFHARLGVQAKQYASGNTVGVGTLQRFKGALQEQEYHIGTVLTTGSFTSGAKESAEAGNIRLVDGTQLVEVMLNSDISVTRPDGEVKLDMGFWSAFEQPEDTDTIPSLEVPQADNFDVLQEVLAAVDTGSDTKPEITRSLEHRTNEDWAPRQADYYSTAGWLLGLLHKDQRVERDGTELRRWGLTRAAEEYLALVSRDEHEAARARLHEAIRSVEVIARVYTALEEAGSLERQEIADILAEETELSGSTTTRRARTVGHWLAQLPEIQTAGRGATETYTLE